MDEDADAALPGRYLTRGRTADLYTAGADGVLKLLLPGFPAALAEREARLGEMLHALGAPVPAVRGTVEVDGRSGVIFERVQGASMLALLMRQPWRVAHYARMFAEVQFAIHQRRAPSMSPVLAQVRRDIEAAKPLPRDLRAKALAALDLLPAGDTLCHMDLHPDQVLVGKERTVVIDWLTAGAGQPAADVARTALLLRMSALPEMPVWQRVLVTTLRKSFLERYLRCYLARNACVARADIAAWLYPLVAARLREGIAAEEAPLIAWLQRNTPSYTATR